MVPQADRFALHFEIPAVLDRLLAKIAVGGNVAGAVFAAAVCDLLARRLQLRDEPLETTGDARERSGALLLELFEKTLVLGSDAIESHAPILKDPPQVLQLDSPRPSGEYRARQTGIAVLGTVPRESHHPHRTDGQDQRRVHVLM